MKKELNTKELVMGGLLLAAGLLLPMVFHSFGMAGNIFLPMHIPVLIGGLLLSPYLALILGVLTPLLSSVLTGMPPIFPMAIIMVVELGFYGLSMSITTRKFKLSVISSLLISMIMGRIAAGITVFTLSLLFGIKINAIVFVTGAIITGLPGIIIQLTVIPTVVYLLGMFDKKISVKS